MGAEDQRLFLTACQHSVLNGLYSCDISPRFAPPTLGIFANMTSWKWDFFFLIGEKELNSRSQLSQELHTRTAHIVPGITHQNSQKMQAETKNSLELGSDCAHLHPLEKHGFEEGIGIFHWAQNEGFKCTLSPS